MDQNLAYDVVIMGGGFAGVTAARELSGRGLKIAVVEAKDRLGGRTWFQEWQGYSLEMGGGWVYWTQPHIWTEICRYGLTLFERPGWPKRYDAPIYALVDGEVVAKPMAENMGRLFPLVAEYAAVAREVFPRPFAPLLSLEKITEFDHLSSADRLDEMELTPLDRVLLDRLVAMHCHNRSDEGAYVEFLRWYALSHFDMEIYLSTASRYQFQEGTTSLIAAMMGDVDADLLLGTAVTAVEQDGSGVRVSCGDGRVLTARYGVVAFPLNVWKQIDFSPRLSEAKQRLSQEEHAGKGLKIYVRVAGCWPDLNMAGDREAAVTTVLVQEARETETLLVVFTVNGRLRPLTKASLEAGLRDFVPEIEVLDFTCHDWATDPHLLGTWCGYRPGQTSRYFEQAQAHEGRLYFAGADIAHGWRGFIDGAIESGLRAARGVLRVW